MSCRLPAWSPISPNGQVASSWVFSTLCRDALGWAEYASTQPESESLLLFSTTCVCVAESVRGSPGSCAVASSSLVTRSGSWSSRVATLAITGYVAVIAATSMLGSFTAHWFSCSLPV